MIFVDSSVFIAAAIVNDRWHAKGKAILEDIDRRKETIYASVFILSETLNAVGKALGGKAAQTVYFSLSDNPQVQLVALKKADLDGAFAKYLKFDGTITFPDTASVQIMENEGITKIASFDSDFDKFKGITRVTEV